MRVWCAGCRLSGGSVLVALLWSQCVHGTPMGVSQPAQLPVVNAAHLTLGAKGLLKAGPLLSPARVQGDLAFVLWGSWGEGLSAIKWGLRHSRTW